MNFKESLRIVWINIVQNKFKALLTSLGIIVGTITIVLVIAIGQGGEAKVAEQFEDLSAESITINPDFGRIFTLGGESDMSAIPKLTRENMEQIFEENSYLKNITIRMNTFKEVSLSEQKPMLQVVGVLDNYEAIDKLYPLQGVNISESDVDDVRPVAVLGNKLAEQYFKGAEDALGKTIKIGEQNYTIIGVLERKGSAAQGVNPDEAVFIPFTVAEKFMNDEQVIPQIVAMAQNIELVPKAMKQMANTLNYLLEDGSFYMLEDTGSRIEAAMESAKTMNMLLMSVGSIVFIVGGIGIMNVLFVSVKERTKEIGILKALGSSRYTIMAQFLLEAIMMSFFGGIVGLVLSCVCLPFASTLGVPLLATPDGYLIALGFALVTGTLFGFYPAFKASKLKPIDALNYE